MKEYEVIVRNSFDEYVETIREHYPQIARALEITKVTFRMLEIDLNYDEIDYPSFHLTYYNSEKYLSVMIDFSFGLSFFANKNFFNTFRLHFSGSFPNDFDYPDNISLDNIEEWMHQIVYQNYLYEKSRKE